MNSRYFKPAAIIIFCIIGIIIYSNSFQNSFHFDDEHYLIRNLAIRDLTNLKAIWNFWPTRFITYFSFAFNYHFNKLNVFGYHLFNFIIHLGSTILVWRLILLTFSTPAMKDKKITNNAFLIALFGGLIFLSHPIQTEAITYIIQRATSLATFFYLSSLCLYVKSRLLQINSNSTSKAYSLILYALSLVMAIISMFTKEIAFTLPFIIILYEFCFLKTNASIKWQSILPFLMILPVAPVIFLSTKTAKNFSAVQRLIDTPVEAYNYFLTQFRVIVTYLRLLFIPLNQNLDYDYPITKSLLELPTLASLFLLVLIIICAIRIFPKYRLVSFGIFWFFVTLLPDSSIIPLRDVIFEYRLYLPMVGFSIFLASSIFYFLGKETPKSIVIVMLVTLVSVYANLTYHRNFIWKDEFTLWNDTVRKSPRKSRPYIGRGYAYKNQGKFSQAISDYNQAIQIDPNSTKAYINRARVYFYTGEYDKSWLDVHKIEALGGKISPRFIQDLKKASNREK